jgi:hypothetical protein
VCLKVLTVPNHNPYGLKDLFQAQISFGHSDEVFPAYQCTFTNQIYKSQENLINVGYVELDVLIDENMGPRRPRALCRIAVDLKLVV